MDYTEIAVHSPPLLTESLAWHLQDLGGQGIVISEIPAEGPVPAELAVKLYRPGTPETLADWRAELEARLSGLAPHFPGATWRVEVRLVPSEDWEHSWKRHWHTLEVGDRLVVKPSWETCDTPGKLIIDLDPAQAFGTGTHATTQLCMRGLEAVLADLDAPAVLDVGTGSGILAIAALLLGARQVVACDIDPVAVQATRENAERNQVADRLEVLVGDVTVLKGQAEVVVANILAEVIAPIASDLYARTRPGGTLLASGIIRARESLVQEALLEAGFALADSQYQGEWVLVTATRPS
ncbi:MAG: 50S ribosomal protein L11 methyltransferase [Candidatus Sericytochromatia bacterium]|nr:50S ribosomal protein L11 methyltransferase [Candidatus Sericytochromatia bacterium]